MNLFGKFDKKTKRLIQGLIADPKLGVELTYRKFVSQERDNVSGEIVSTYADTSLRAAKLNHTKRSQEQWEGKVEVGDVVFIFSPAALPSGRSSKDRIVYPVGGQEHVFKSVDDIFDIATCITLEGGQ